MANVYMKVDGVKGSVTAQNYQGWLELMSSSFGLTKHAPMKVGNMNDRTTSPPEFRELQIYKMLDAGSNALFSKSVSDRATTQVEIHIVDPAKQHAYYKLVLNDVVFSYYHLHVYEDMLPFESLKLSYAKLQQTYVHQDSMGKLLPPSHAGYDLAKTEKL